jgi:regulator of RNase E activity RraA
MNHEDIQPIIERFARIPTSTLSDVLDSFGTSGVLTGIHSLCPDMKLVGPAVTVREVSGSLGSYSLADFRVGEMIQALSRFRYNPSLDYEQGLA